MNATGDYSSTETQILVDNYLPTIGEDQVVRQILEGLAIPPRQISSMYFYDAIGSKFFEEITTLPEYYPTRIEKELLRGVAPLIGEPLADSDVIELGSGDCSKISILFDAVDPINMGTIRYLPLDVSREAIEESAHLLIERYPGLSVQGLVADFMTQLHLLPSHRDRLFCFLGSTIGNLTKEQRTHLLQSLAQLMQKNDRLLLGIDLVKPVHLLEKAYNDSRKVTARFNKNILNVVNTLIGSDFDPDSFAHMAFFNAAESRIEMHLVASRDMVVTCPHHPSEIRLKAGESIHTENSHKFQLPRFSEELIAAGLQVDELAMDPEQHYCLLTISRYP